MRSRAMPYYEFEEGIFEIDEFDCASIFVIVGEKKALVLDTGTGIGDLRWVIEYRITDKSYDVIITHNHTDHAGGAGFFDSVWIHKADADWHNAKVGPTLKERKWYANLIIKREDKNYAYDIENDIIEWPGEPEKKILEDGMVFDLGGRKVTIYHCPGHTPGQCVAIDDKSRILFIADACNRELLLIEELSDIALKSFEGIQNIKGKQFEKVYNSHHDFRGVGAPIGKEVLPNVIQCLREMKDGTVIIKKVPDPLSEQKGEKTIAEYGNVHISMLD